MSAVAIFEIVQLLFFVLHLGVVHERDLHDASRQTPMFVEVGDGLDESVIAQSLEHTQRRRGLLSDRLCELLEPQTGAAVSRKCKQHSSRSALRAHGLLRSLHVWHSQPG